MLGFQNVDENTGRVIDEMNARMNLAVPYMGQYNWGKTQNHSQLDHRDFKPMTLLLDEPTEGTPDEKKAIMETQIRDMLDAFDSGDAQRKKPYLDKMFDLLDRMDPEKADMSDPKDVKDLFAYIALNQSYAQKRAENLDYYYERYNTPEALAAIDIKRRYAISAGSIMFGNIVAEGKKIDAAMTLPKPHPDYPDAIHAFYEINRQEFDQLAVPKEERGINTKVTLPKSLAMANAFVKQDDLRAIPADRRAFASGLVTEIFGTYYARGTEQGNVIKDAGQTWHSSVFVDGKSIVDIQKEQYPELKGFEAFEMSGAILAKALASGTQRVEMAQYTKNAAGGFDVNVKPLQLDLSEVQPPLKEDYGLLRRTIFNWGPFRCKTRQEKAEILFANDPNRETRHEVMKQNARETVAEPGVEKARQRDAAAAARIKTTIKEIAEPAKEKAVQKTKVQEIQKEAGKSMGR